MTQLLERHWRFWPHSTRERRWVQITTALFLAYLITVVVLRFAAMFDPWTSNGDQPQAVWHYWRYHVDGAFPSGDLLTDYAFVMHAPPAWWALMASLSTFVAPLTAAKVLNLVAYLGACAAMYFGVSARSNHFVGLAASFLLARSFDFYGITVGGYARSFGPVLVLMFLGAFLTRRHRLTLAVLVLQAALYPSVVMPCGLAYGVYVVVAGPMRARLRRMAGMFVAGLLIIAFGMYQDIEAPKWWGPVVTEAQALRMPAWGRGGRIAEAPLRPWRGEMIKNFGRAFKPGGHALPPRVSAFVVGHNYRGVFVLSAVLAVACVVVWWLRRRRGSRVHDPVPWELALLFAGMVAAYFLARFLAFKLYLPYRTLAHVMPYIFYMAMPMTWWFLLRNTLRSQLRAGVVTLAVTVIPTFAVFGDGVEIARSGYGTNRAFANMLTFIQQLPVDAQLAGEFQYIDRVPLFTWHKAYVTRNLAHPFRPGYYAETERRIRLVYTALYGSDLDEITRSLEAAQIDYLVYGATMFGGVDKQLFEPVKADLVKVFNANAPRGFALQNPPKSAIVFSEGNHRVVSVKKLREAVDHGDIPALVPAPLTAPKGKRALPLLPGGIGPVLPDGSF